MSLSVYERRWAEETSSDGRKAPKSYKFSNFFTPWRRLPKRPFSKKRSHPHSPDATYEFWNSNPMQQKFTIYPQNMHLDIYTKRAALKASAPVVSLECYSGEEKINQCSGTIIESTGTYSIILTAAYLLKCSTGRNSVADDIKVTVHLSDGRSFDGQIEARDFHYGIAAIKIQSGTPLPTASLTHLKDSISVDPCQLHVNEEMSIQLRPHASSFDLTPGDIVIALGRSIKPYDIMAAPGEFSIDRCEHGCAQLLMSSCRITKCGIGGPLINRNGEVIGMCLHANISTEFLPINIASIWWEHYKKCRQRRRLRLGMKVTNLYAVPVEFTERIIRKFPDVLEGVFVEEVFKGSSAAHAGIKHNDVIIQFGGKRMRSSLELFENMWNKVGESADLVVIREGDDVPLHLNMVVG